MGGLVVVVVGGVVVEDGLLCCRSGMEVSWCTVDGGVE